MLTKNYTIRLYLPQNHNHIVMLHHTKQSPLLKTVLLLSLFHFLPSQAQTVTTLTGAGEGYADGTLVTARFNKPMGVDTDQAGNIYVADTYNDRIRKITPEGTVSSIAGSTRGYADGSGANAKFNLPMGVAVANDGTLYVADSFNNRIRKITQDGVATTLAGSGTSGGANGTGTAAQFYSPRAIIVGNDGNIYISEYNGHRIRKVTPEGVVTTLAGGGQGYMDGTGTSARFNHPKGLDMDAEGNIYVVDSDNQKIRKITSDGVVTTLAGSSAGYADGDGTDAKFQYPSGIAVDNLGNVFVTDTNNQRIRMVTPNGDVTTIAGGATTGTVNGTGTDARFNYPEGITIDVQGILYIADFSNNRIRKIVEPLAKTETFSGSKVCLYPNPASNSVNVIAESILSYEVSIFDSNGRYLLSKKITGSENIDISALQNGVYIVKLSTNKGETTRKLVKN